MDRPWARVPDWVGPALRPELIGATEEIIAAVRAGVPEYARPLEGQFGRRITEGVSVALSQFVDLLGVDSAPGDLRVYRSLGQLEHREGRTLAALQSAYQVGTRTAWRRIAGSSAARQLPADVIFALAEALFTYVEQLGAASVAGWAYEDARNAESVPDPPARPRRTARPAAASVGGRGGAGGRGRGLAAARTAGRAGRRGCRGRGGQAAGCDRSQPGPGQGWCWCPCRNGPCPAGPPGTTACGSRCATGPRCSVRWSRWCRAGRSVARAQATWPLHVAGLLGAAADRSGPGGRSPAGAAAGRRAGAGRGTVRARPGPAAGAAAGCRGAGRADAARVARRPATCPWPPRPCTCTRRRCATGWRRCARRSATPSTTRPPPGAGDRAPDDPPRAARPRGPHSVIRRRPRSLPGASGAGRTRSAGEAHRLPGVRAHRQNRERGGSSRLGCGALRTARQCAAVILRSTLAYCLRSGPVV